MTDFRPSNTERFLNCTLWSSLPKSPRDPSNLRYLEERTKDHDRLEKGDFKESEQTCKNFQEDCIQGCEVFKESRIDISFGSETKGSDFGGTPDLYAYDPSKKLCHVIDYKTGFHIVEAENNKQLLSYAALILEKHKDWNIEHFVLSILNMQRDMPLTWSVSVDQVKNHRKKIEKVFKLVHNHALLIAKKGDWCRYCDSKTNCPLWRSKEKATYTEMDTDSLLLTCNKRKDEINARKSHLKSQEDGSDVFQYKVSTNGTLTITGEKNEINT